jgi:hypothetical protein
LRSKSPRELAENAFAACPGERMAKPLSPHAAP